MRMIVVGGAMALVLAGCASPAPKAVQLSSRFDAARAQELIRPGVNIVSGSALIRQKGGGVVTCAGLPVLLIPDTTYARERMTNLYGNAQRGFNPYHHALKFIPDDPAYTKSMKQTLCDAQGKFSFDDVADGSFFVASTIVWNVGGPQGGSVMQAVSVSGGEVKQVVLSP